MSGVVWQLEDDVIIIKEDAFSNTYISFNTELNLTQAYSENAMMWFFGTFSFEDVLTYLRTYYPTNEK